jgi:hypothetical protein
MPASLLVLMGRQLARMWYDGQIPAGERQLLDGLLDQWGQVGR